MFNFFSKKKAEIDTPPLLVDMHSHLLPGIDDGAATIHDSIALIREFAGLGYKKLITTPHIMGDFYKNTPEIIFEKLKEVRQAIKENNIDIQLEAAAEYYLDEWFIAKLNDKKNLLTFGDNFVLFETSYLNEPSHLYEAVFQMKSLGLIPIMAHPERYTYLYGNFKKVEEMYEKGVLFQININSLSGYYNKTSEEFAVKLIEKNMVTFIGSDCHSMKHIDVLKKTRKTKAYQKAMELYLFNNTLL